MGETVTALDAGLDLTGLVEHDSVPWEALPGRMMGDDRGEWSVVDHPERIPLSYTLQASQTLTSDPSRPHRWGSSGPRAGLP